MSKNTGNSDSRCSLTRTKGVGLTSTSFSRAGLRDPAQPREIIPLSTPNRMIISGSSLGAHRTNSDRYTSGYSRLSILSQKNSSASNVTSGANVKLDITNPIKTDADINQNSQASLRKNLSATQLSKNDKVMSVSSVHRSQSTNIHLGDASDVAVRAEKDRKYGTVDYVRQKPQKPEIEISNNKLGSSPNTDIDSSYSSIPKIENYDLEQDEEDADAPKVKDRVDGSHCNHLDVSSPHLPGIESEYHSPRIETNVDLLSTNMIGSRSQDVSETLGSYSQSGYISNKDKSATTPQRPARTKSLRKQNINQSQLSPLSEQSSWQQGAKSSISKPSTVGMFKSTDTGAVGEHIKTGDCNEKLSPYQSEYQGSRSPGHGCETPGRGESEIPVVKPRIHRRLTKRAVIVKHLVSQLHDIHTFFITVITLMLLPTTSVVE